MVLAIVILFGIISLVCNIIILIDMFEDEIWKGLLGLLFWPYLVYYAFAEFDHEKKVLIVTGLLISSALSFGIPMIFQ
jgi:hypothetical protein